MNRLMKVVDSTKIVDGGKIFKLVDTWGLPLDIIVMELRERGLGFNVLQFAQSAKKAGWKSGRVHWMLKSSGNVGGWEKCLEVIKFVYGEEDSV